MLGNLVRGGLASELLEEPAPRRGDAIHHVAGADDFALHAELFAELGEEDFEQARKRGWAMTFEQAVEYALESNAASST